MSSRRLADLHDVPVLDTQRVHERLSLISIGVQDALVSILSQVDRSEFLQTHSCTHCISEKQKSSLTGPGSCFITFLLLASLVMAIVEGSKSGWRTVWNRRSRFPLLMLSLISLCCQMVSEKPSKGANCLPFCKTMSGRRLADVYKLTHLSFQLLLPLDCLPLVGQSIGIRHNNRSGHSRTSGPMMADGNKATSLVLREIASICKRPCTTGTDNSRHIWRTSARYLWWTSGGRLGDV